MQKLMNIPLRELLPIIKEGKLPLEGLFYDWFCKSESLPRKARVLSAKLVKICKSPKIDLDNNYGWFKNNCPMYGHLYDDIRISNLATGDVIYTIVPKDGHKTHGGKAAVYGKENGFEKPLIEGTWKDVLNYFGV